MKLDKIFRTALEYKASDIYITSGCKPFLRIRGDLVPIQEHPEMTPEMAQDYLLDTMSENDRKEFEAKKDLDFAVDLPGVARFRGNVFVQRKGMGGVFRLIPSKVQTISELGLPETLKKVVGYENGLVLVTGPTGSGKTTTLAAVIDEFNVNYDMHIVTLEDPIEYVHENKKSIVEQREVGSHTESFQAGLRGALRQDTDIVLVGEMRDLETISLALTAAETGHLVLATLHTSGAKDTIDRIVDVFPASQQNQVRYQLAATLRTIAWQKLLKRADGTGQVAAFELLFSTPAVSNMIRKNKTYQLVSVLETGAAEGMQSMKQAILELLESGVITEEEAQDNLPPEMEL